MKSSSVYMIDKSHGRDSGRCGTFTIATAVVQQTKSLMLYHSRPSLPLYYNILYNTNIL